MDEVYLDILGFEELFHDFEDFDRVKVLKYVLKDNANSENSKLLSL
jgi:hypothetical protein